MPGRLRTLLPSLALLALVALAYLPLFTVPAGWIWDDDAYVTRNAALESADGLRRIWTVPGTTPQYYPLVFTSFWVERRLWGLAPAGYHAVNLLLHGVGALLLHRLLRRLECPGAWLAAALWAVHPVQVESVAWVTERKNVLSGALGLLALLLLVRGRPRAGFVPYLGALLSKTVTATVPAVALVLAWWRSGRVARREVLSVVPYLAAGIGLAALTVHLEKTSVGAVGEPWDLSVLQRLQVAGRAVWLYLGSLAWPSDLSFVYPRWRPDPSDPAAWVPSLLAAAVLATLWALRGRIGRGPLAAALLFGGILLPALGFFDVFPFRYASVADHFQYHAAAAPLALAASGWAWVRARRRVPADLGAAVVLAVLAALTAARIPVYAGPETLWRDTLRRNDDSWLAHNNLGKLLVERGRVEDGLVHLRRAQAREPLFPESNYNVGWALQLLGRPAEAEEAFRRALAVRPNHIGTRERLGGVLFDLGRPTEAVEHLEAAVRMDPATAVRRVNLAMALDGAGRRGEALAQLDEAVRLAPDDARIRALRTRARERAGGGRLPPAPREDP